MKRRAPIVYPPGVPRWFTYAMHRLSIRDCQKAGRHEQTAWCSCDHCGLIIHRPGCDHPKAPWVSS